MDAPRPHRPVSSEFRVWFQTRRSHDHERRAHGGYAESSVKASSSSWLPDGSWDSTCLRAWAQTPFSAHGFWAPRTLGHETVGRGLERGARALLVSASRLFHGGKRTSPAVSHRASRRLLLTCSCAHRRERGDVGDARLADDDASGVPGSVLAMHSLSFLLAW